MNTHPLNNPRYEVTHYDTQEVTTQTMTRRQIAELNPQGVDYFLSVALGIWAFRTADGHWVECRDGIWPGFGNTCITLVRAMQLNAPEFITPREIAALTGYSTLRDNNALSARLKAIREAHKESFRRPHFFRSRRSGGFGLAWNPEKTFCWVERIPSHPSDH